MSAWDPVPLTLREFSEGSLIAEKLRALLPSEFIVNFDTETGDQWLVYNRQGLHCGGFSKFGGDVWYRVTAQTYEDRIFHKRCPPQHDHLVRRAIASVLENVNSLAA